MTVVLEPRTQLSVLHVEGALRAPVKGELSQRIQAVVGRGAHVICLDLSRLSHLDAAGVGELVRVFNTANAAGCVLGIAQPTARVRQLLELAGVLSSLAADAHACHGASAGSVR